MREGRAEAARAEARDGYIPKQSQHFQWLRFAAAWADQQDQAKPAAIYFRTTMLPPDFNKPGRGGADDAHALAFLWADLDYGTVGHKPPPGATLTPGRVGTQDHCGSADTVSDHPLWWWPITEIIRIKP